MKLYFAKVKVDAIIPSNRDEDAGYDLYPCFEEGFMQIEPMHTKLVPLGIASAFDSNYVMLLKERGSTGSIGLAQRAGVIDSGYRGEYLAPITNLNEKPLRIVKKDVLSQMEEEEKKQFVLYPYEKAIAQGILLEIPKVEKEEIPYEQLKQIASLRQEGRLGSSGK